MIPFRYIISTTVATLLLTLLIGCTSKEKSGSSSDTVTIEHAMGSTQVPVNPQKIVILTNEGTEALLAIGVVPIGAVKSWTGDPWYDHIADRLADTQVLGTETQVNLEALAALEPDVIIGNKMRQEKIYDKLSMIAPTVFATTLRGAWQDNFKLYSKTVGKAEEGKAKLEQFEDNIKALSEKAGDKRDLQISVIRFLPGQTRVYKKNSFSGVILNKLGFKRPPAQDEDTFADQISKEQMEKADGDVIFYFTYNKASEKSTAREKEWLNDPLFKALKGAKNGKVFEVSDATWNTSGGIISANIMLEDIENFLEQL